MGLEPIALFNIFKMKPFLGVANKNKSDYVSKILRNVIRNFKIPIDNSFKCCLLIFSSFKRSISKSELIDQDTKTPNIDPLIIEISLHNFWWNIIKSSTKSLPFAKNKKFVTRVESRQTNQNQPI